MTCQQVLTAALSRLPMAMVAGAKRGLDRRHRRGHYYGNEPMSKLDKALFAFASYNAGAGRVSQLRKEAARRGLDPNVWFHNVEYVAAEKVGAETMTYMANIYKYYIAYSLILEERAEREQALDKLKSGPR